MSMGKLTGGKPIFGEIEFIYYEDALKGAALAFVEEVQTKLLSKDENLMVFDMDKLGALLELLKPQPCD